MLAQYQKELQQIFSKALSKFKSTVQPEKDCEKNADKRKFDALHEEPQEGALIVFRKTSVRNIDEIKKETKSKEILEDEASFQKSNGVNKDYEKCVNESTFVLPHEESQERALILFRRTNDRNIDEMKFETASKLKRQLSKDYVSFQKSNGAYQIEFGINMSEKVEDNLQTYKNSIEKELFESKLQEAMHKVKKIYFSTMREALGQNWNSDARIDEVHKDSKKQSIAIIHSLRDSSKGDYSRCYDIYDDCIRKSLIQFKLDNDRILVTFTKTLCSKAKDALESYKSDMRKVKEVYILEKELNDRHISSQRMALAILGNLKDWTEMSPSKQNKNEKLSYNSPQKEPPNTEENAKEKEETDTDNNTESEKDKTSNDKPSWDNSVCTGGPEAKYNQIMWDLQKKIKNEYEIALANNKKNQVKAEGEADELIEKIKRSYLDEFVKQRGGVYVKESQLLSLHATLVKNLLQHFKDEWPQLPNKQDCLEKELHNLLEEQEVDNDNNMTWLQRFRKCIINFAFKKLQEKFSFRC